MACPLDDLNDTMMNPAIVVEKIQRMINNNIAIVLILVLLIAFLGVSLFYFLSSIQSTLKNYYVHRDINKLDPSTTNSLKDKNADNEIYEEPSDPNDAEHVDTTFKIKIDPTKFMPKYRRDFIKDLEINHKQYNEELTQFMTRNLNYTSNDDKVDSKILYKDYDNYAYDYSTE